MSQEKEFHTHDKVTEPTPEVKVESKEDRVEEVVREDADPKDFELPHRMDLRIVSDGTRTSVFDSEGHAVGLVQSIVWKQSVGGTPVCKITLLKVPVNLVAKGTRVKYKAAFKLHRSKERVAPPIEEKDATAADSTTTSAA